MLIIGLLLSCSIFASRISSIMGLPVLLLTYFLKKFNVRTHDEHILAQVESFCEGHYYQNPKWKTYLPICQNTKF